MTSFAPSLRRRLAQIGLSACAALPWAVQAAPLTLAVAHNPMSLPIYVAAREGYFAQEGLDLKLIECPSGARCMSTMLDGGAELATVADTPVVFRSFERSDFVLIGTFATSGDDTKIITRQDTGIQTPRQLAGRRVGVTRGTSNHYHLDAYLLMHGVDPQSVQTVDLPPDGMGAALAAGKVDATSTFEPHATRVMQSLGPQARRLSASSAYTVTFNLVTMRRMLGTREPELAAVLRAVDRAERYIREQPEPARRLLIERLKLDAAVVDTMWASLNYRLRLEPALIKTLESEARWALREGYVRMPGIPNYLGFIHTGPLRAVAPAAVSLAR
jgi:ABC-type nitrate/sulfonate/bicarbonate transport system substrate-binding protein